MFYTLTQSFHGVEVKATAKATAIPSSGLPQPQPPPLPPCPLGHEHCGSEQQRAATKPGRAAAPQTEPVSFLAILFFVSAFVFYLGRCHHTGTVSITFFHFFLFFFSNTAIPLKVSSLTLSLLLRLGPCSWLSLSCYLLTLGTNSSCHFSGSFSVSSESAKRGHT